jgi:prepilin-type N-terminal cleavage/methylation domain-containing protein
MKRRLPIRQINNSEGFTLLEVLIVVFMLGILMAIGLPSWIALLEGQRLNNAQAQVLDSLRATQKKAQQTKTNRDIKFNTAENPPTIKYLGKTETLGNGNIPAGTIIMSTSPDGEDTITFDGSSYGNIPTESVGFTVTVATKGGRKKMCNRCNSIRGNEDSRK